MVVRELELDLDAFEGPFDLLLTLVLKEELDLPDVDVAAIVLAFLDRLYRFRPPALFALYVAIYTGFRFYLEQLRVDPAREVAGMRLNAWVSLVVFVAAVAFFVWWQFLRGRRRPRRAPGEPRAKRRPAMTIPRGRRP